MPGLFGKRKMHRIPSFTDWAFVFPGKYEAGISAPLKPHKARLSYPALYKLYCLRIYADFVTRILNFSNGTSSVRELGCRELFPAKKEWLI